MSELESGEILDNDGQAFSPDAQEVTAEQSSSAPDYSEMEPGELAEMLQARDTELSSQKEQYNNLRSMNDKRYNEQSQQMAKLQGMIEQMNAGQNQQEAYSVEDQKAFDQEWADKIADDPGKSTIEFFRGMIGDLREEMREQLTGVSSTVNEKFLDLDPTFKENRELVEQISNEYGIDKAAAVKIAAKFAPKQTKQPGAVAAPGRVAGDSNAVAPAQKQSKSSMGASPIGDMVAQQVMQMAGLSEKEAKAAMEVS